MKNDILRIQIVKVYCQVIEMPHLSIAQKSSIITLLGEGWSERRVADRFQVSKSTIHDVKVKWNQRHSLERQVGTGRPKVSTEEEDYNLVNFLENHPFETAIEARHMTNFPGSVRTARRRVKTISDLRNRPAAKKPFLTQRNKEERIGFTLQHYMHDINFWGNVVFTDEKVFQSCYNGRIRVYRPPNTRYDERYTQSVRNSGRFSVNVWGWMSANGLGMCINIANRFNALAYIDILENIMLPSVNAVFPENNFVYQHDNCRVHTARIVTGWLQQHDVTVLPWPARSADLNPIENVWGRMVKTINRNNDFHPRNAEDLWDTIHEVWHSFTPDYAHNLVASLPRRLNSILENNGRALKY